MRLQEVIRGGWVAALAAVALSACAPSGDGPLGQSDEASSSDVFTVCTPLADGAVSYVGIPLPNTGEAAAELTGFTVEADGGGEVALLVDVEASELDQLVGAVTWPDPESPAWMSDVLARAVAVNAAVVPAGQTADLLVAIGSVEPGANAAGGDTRVRRIEITYRSGGREYTLTRVDTVEAVADGACAGD